MKSYGDSECVCVLVGAPLGSREGSVYIPYCRLHSNVTVDKPGVPTQTLEVLQKEVTGRAWR